MKKNIKTKGGYTLIETMIAVSLFIVIVTIGMGSLLNANMLSNKSQKMRSIMDSMSFTIEDMSRSLRTGYNYRCINDGNYSSSLSTPRSCPNGGGGIVFEPATGNPLTKDQWVYKIQSLDNGVTFNISKSTDGGTTWIQLNPSEVIINSVSGFSVLGAESPNVTPPDYQQPFATIRLTGKIIYQNVTTPFSLQTSVSERIIDI